MGIKVDVKLIQLFSLIIAYVLAACSPKGPITSPSATPTRPDVTQNATRLVPEASPSKDMLQKKTLPKVDSPQSNLPMAPPKIRGHMVRKGLRTITGTMYSTKGARPMVAGVIIECPKHSMRPKKTDCRPILRTWSGRRVTVHGELSVYRCGPMEQCLMGGAIPYLLNVTRIEKAAPATPNTKLENSSP